jgi:hypothetical protein
VTDPYGRILGFLDRIRYFSIKQLLSCTHEAEWTPFQTHYIFFGSAGNRTRASGSVAKNSDHVKETRNWRVHWIHVAQDTPSRHVQSSCGTILEPLRD